MRSEHVILALQTVVVLSLYYTTTAASLSSGAKSSEIQTTSSTDPGVAHASRSDVEPSSNPCIARASLSDVEPSSSPFIAHASLSDVEPSSNPCIARVSFSDVEPSSNSFIAHASLSDVALSLNPFIEHASLSDVEPSSNPFIAHASLLDVAPPSNLDIALSSHSNVAPSSLSDYSTQTPNENGNDVLTISIAHVTINSLTPTLSSAHTTIINSLTPTLSDDTTTNTNFVSASSSGYHITSSVESNGTHETKEKPVADVSTSKLSTTTFGPLITVPPSHRIAPVIPFPFKLKYDTDFHQDLENPNSKLYEEAVKNYTSLIKLAYENVTGFENITITKFWNGSVGVDYEVWIEYNVSKEQFEQEMNNVMSFLNTTGVNRTYLHQTFEENIQNAFHVLEDVCHTSSSLCKENYLCMLDTDSRPICRPLCTNVEAITRCQNGGQCVQDAPNNFICRCPQDKTILYGGQYCEVQTEKLELKKDYIIAIACGAGGGIILILIIVIIILILRRRQHSKDDKDTALQQSFKSIKGSDDGLHQSPTGYRNSALLDYNDPTFRRLEQRTEEMRLQSRASAGSGQAPLRESHNLSNRYVLSNLPHTRQIGQEMETTRFGDSQSQLSQDRAPNRGQQSIIQPRLPTIHPNSDYIEIDDTYSKSIMYQPTKAMRPLTEFQQGRPLHSPMNARVYDYSNGVEPKENSEQSQAGSGFYDFAYENSRQGSNQMQDPYSIKRPHIVGQKRFS